MSDNNNTDISTSSSAAFHIVGDAFVDLFSFLDGDWPEKGGDSQLTHPIQTFAGGSAMNTATHLKALLDYFLNAKAQHESAEASLVLHTVLNPDDHYGQILVKHAEQHGFPLVNNRPSGGEATGHCVAIVAGQERSFMTYRGCVDTFQASHLKTQQIIASPQHVQIHIAGFYNLSGFHASGKEGIIQQIQQIRQARAEQYPNMATMVSLVPQHDATKKWDGGIDQLAPLLDFLIMNELEAKHIMEQGRKRRRGIVQTTTETSLPDNYNLEELVQDCATYFQEICPQTCIVLTKGPEGAVALLNGQIIASQSTVQVKPVDPTGAGDSFCAGFLHGLWAWYTTNNGSDATTSDIIDFGTDRLLFAWPTAAIQQALVWGCAMGTAAVLVPGASIPAPKKEVLKYLEGIQALK